MGTEVTLSGGYRILARAFLREKANRTDDPRHVFYVAMLSNDRYEAYEAEVRGKTVTPETYKTGPVNGHMEILYARRHGWIEDK